jgi:PKD repeat protein
MHIMRPRKFIRTVLIGAAVAVFATAPTALAAPVARFSATPTPALVNRSIIFDGAASTCDVAPCRYQWTWFRANGRLGGRMGEGQKISYAFTTVGTKRVVLKVTNSTSTHGSSALTRAISVT